MLAIALLTALIQAPADTVHLVLVATTDVHGRVMGWDHAGDTAAAGGLTRAATVLDSLRARYPREVVLLDAGDALQGGALAAYFARVEPRDLHPVIDAMNTLGYDAATPGDHDFDFGAAVFDRALAGSTFPWVSANLFRGVGDTLLLPAFTVLQRNGVRIAVAGFTTPAILVGNRERLRGRVGVQRIGPLIEPLVRSMRHEADLVVVLSHSGLDRASSYDTTGIGLEDAGLRFAESRARPDLVVLGHSHEVLRDSVIGGVHFVQPPPRAAGLSVTHVTLIGREGRLEPAQIRSELVRLDTVPEDPRLVRRLGEPHAAVRNWLATKLGEADSSFSLTVARVEDTPLLRFVHSVQRAATGATISAASVVNLHAGLARGEITRRELFALYPEEQTLLSVRISGADLKAYLERSARYFYSDSTGLVAVNRYVPAASYDLVGGASYTLDLSQPPGSRVTRLEVGGAPVQPGDSFSVALASDRQEGRGNFPAVSTAPVVRSTGTPIRDLLMDAIASRGRLRVRDFAGHDWTLAPPELAQRARAVFVLPPAAAVPAPVPVATAAELRYRDSLERAQGRADSVAQAPVAVLRLPANPGGDGSLARLLADAYRNELRADLAFVPLDAGWGPMAAGPVSPGELKAVVAAEPGLLMARVPGSVLRVMLEELVADSAPCCELSGAEIRFDPRRNPLSRVRDVSLATGGEIDDRRQYAVALSGHLVTGDSTLRLRRTSCRGSACPAPIRLTNLSRQEAGHSPVDLLAAYLRRQRQPVTPPAAPRIVAVP
jgi:2',3'-cyclic-nucleotide 2'-phosphodiesterase/3'-nucleotidase